MEQDRENRRKERGGKIMKTLEQEVLKKIAKKSLFVKLVNTERNESLSRAVHIKRIFRSFRSRKSCSENG